MIKELSPAAARLLLAFLSTPGNEDTDVLIARSGIHGVETYARAYRQLRNAGYLRKDESGTPYVQLSVEGQ